MTEETDYDPIRCPVGDCTYRDRIRSVAGHVSRRRDDAHSWDRFDYDGARDFVMTEKRRQRGELDGDRESGDGASSEASGGSGTPASNDEDAASSSRSPHDSAEVLDPKEDAFELGFERDALVLLELARKYDLSSLDDLGTFQLADLYSLLADLKNSADDARKEVRDELLEQVREDRAISADLGSVTRTTYQYRRVRDEREVSKALADADVDPEAVRSFDKSKLKDAIEDSDIEEDAVFDIEERPQIRISDSNDDRRRERFDRLDSEIQSLADEE